MQSTILPTYETDRIILKSRTMDHLEACLAMDLDPEVVKYIRPTPPEEEHRAFLKESIQRVYESGLGFWSVFEKGATEADCTFIGWVLLVPLAGVGPEIEIGYRFVQASWGKGYASEAASIIRDHAFSSVGLKSICAVTNPENEASQKVLRKIGMKRKEDRFAYDMILPYFELNKDAWKSAHRLICDTDDSNHR